MNKRLYRSRKRRLAAGVCAGLGEYLGVDPSLVRLVWVLLFVYNFWLAAAVYGLAIILVPEGDEDVVEVADSPYRSHSIQIWLAVGLICVGGFMLLQQFLPQFPPLRAYLKAVKGAIWPIALISGGLWLIFGQKRK